MAGGTHIPVWTGRVGATLVVRPEGACTVAICETLEAGLKRLVDASIQQVCFDLSGAEWLDSTFTGFLVGLATRGRRGGPQIHLLRPSERVRKCLQDMHVLKLFRIEDALEAQPAGWEQLPQIEADAPGTARRVVDTHEELIRADERNEAVFAPVVKLFRERGQGAP